MLFHRGTQSSTETAESRYCTKSSKERKGSQRRNCYLPRQTKGSDGYPLFFLVLSLAGELFFMLVIPYAGYYTRSQQDAKTRGADLKSYHELLISLIFLFGPSILLLASFSVVNIPPEKNIDSFLSSRISLFTSFKISS